MILIQEAKKGSCILIDRDPYVVTETQTQTPSARGAATLVKVRVRNLRTGQVLDKSFKSGEKLEEPDLDKRTLQFLYRDQELLQFMDLQSYEQYSLPVSDFDEEAPYLVENLELKATFFEGEVLNLELPDKVDIKVKEVEAGTKGDTATGGATKGATLANGLVVQVPLFIKAGEVIRINTKTGKYSERAG